jgi:hypothetical protein
MDLHEVPKKVQYITIDSEFVNGSNNTFTIDFSLDSNVHMEDLTKVIGFKVVDFYVTQVGESDSTGNTDVSKYIDVVCEDIPKRAQILDERNGQILARIPLERTFSGSNSFILRDKQWRSFQRQTSLFNPISIQNTHFKLYESQGDGDYELLKPSVSFYMIIEITTIDVKKKPRNRELQILDALDRLMGKIDNLNHNVKKLPDAEQLEKARKETKKYPFSYLVLLIVLILGGVYYISKQTTSAPPQPSF